MDNRYTVAFPHKYESYAKFCRGSLLPQRFVLPSTRKAHCGRVYDRVFREQGLDVICKGVGRMNRVEPVGDIA